MIPVRPFKRENLLRYGAYYASRLLPHPLLRGSVEAMIRSWINARRGATAGPTSEEAQSTLKVLRDAGIATIASPLKATQIDEVLSFLASAPVSHGSSQEPVNADTQDVSSAAYDLPTIMACPHLLEAMNSPHLLEIAAGFLGCKPTLSGVGLRWSYASHEAASTVQKFHRDQEDWKILRLFVYLTDVFDDSGPHQFVEGSHKTAGRFRLRPYSDEYIDRKFGREKVMTVSGPKGTAFLGNMWGIHRGVPPTARPRLLFSCTYTMTATPIYQYDPVKMADSHLYDRYANRLLIC